MSDETPLVRQWKLLRILGARRHGLTVRELADEAGVTEKTIRRDLDHFRLLGFPLLEEVGERGLKRWRMASPRPEMPLVFSFDEAIALHLGRRFLEPLAGTLLWEAAQSAFRKIRASLSEGALAYIESLRGLLHTTSVGISDYSTKAEAIDALMQAIEDQKAVHIAYRSLRATEAVTRDVYPYGLVFHRGRLYLVAFAPQDDRIKTYKVDRIDSVEISTWPFRRPENFDLSQHLAGSFGVFEGDGEPVLVRVRFAPGVARYVQESRWHPSQQLTSLPDGGLVAAFRLSSREEIKSWVLSFGSNALVLEPAALREDIRGELQSMLQTYQSPPPEPSRTRPRPALGHHRRSAKDEKTTAD